MDEELENGPEIETEPSEIVDKEDPAPGSGEFPDEDQEENDKEIPVEDESGDDPETVTKRCIKYYVQIKKDGEKKKSFKSLETEDEDWDPFVVYDIFNEDEEAAEWDDEESIPNGAVLISSVKTTGIVIPDDDSIQEEQPDDEEESEEEIFFMKYYYVYYDREVPVDPSSEKVKGICVECKYCITSERMIHFRHHCHRHYLFRSYSCCHPEHQTVNYISGEVRNNECYLYNNYGECEFYEKIPDEATEDVPVDSEEEIITGDSEPSTELDEDIEKNLPAGGAQP